MSRQARDGVRAWIAQGIARLWCRFLKGVHMSRHFGGAAVKQDNKAQIALFLSFFFLLLFAALTYRILVRSSSTTTNPAAAVVIREDAPELAMANVVVPLRKVDSGQKLIPAMFKLEKRPAVGLDYGVLNDIEMVQGYYSSTILLPGQPVALAAVSKSKPISVVSAKIPPGFRAVTIRVNATSAVEGWARPGSRVDVDWLSQVNGQQGVTTIVHNAEVLSANRQSAVNPNNPEVAIPTTVTLLVTARDAKAIKLAQSAGALELVLRGDNDTGKVEEGGSITVSDLLHDSRTSVKKRARRGGSVVIGGKKFIVGYDGSLAEVPGTH